MDNLKLSDIASLVTGPIKRSITILCITTLSIGILMMTLSREALLKGKARYKWPPCTNWFRSATFDVEKLFAFSTKQATLIRRSTVLSLPLLLVFPVHSFECSYAELSRF
jgi:hypothetical protein